MKKRVQLSIEALVVGAIVDAAAAGIIVGTPRAVPMTESAEVLWMMLYLFAAQAVVIGYILLRLRNFKNYRKSDTSSHYGAP